MRYKSITSIEQKVLNYIRNEQYAQGINALQEYIALPKFIPTDGHHHGSVNVNDIKLRLDAIQHNVWSTGPIEFFTNEMQHDWTIVVNNDFDENGNYLDGYMLESESAITKFGPFKSRYDAAVFGVNMLMKEA